ncbi:MAG: hypothetical protein Q7R91_01510 [bacterium]|nr:hypothetical protein [bacterium]
MAISRKKILANNKVMRKYIQDVFPAEGARGVQKALIKKGVNRSIQTIRNTASEMGITLKKIKASLVTVAKLNLEIDPAQLIAEATAMPEKKISETHLIEASVFPMIVEETTLENPFVVEIPSGQMPIIRCINTPMIGVCADTHPFRNPLSNTLRLSEVLRGHADTAGFPVVVVTGNFIHVDTLKYSKLRAHRSLVSQTRPIVLSDLTMEEDREVNFVSVEDRIKDRIAMMKKAATDEEGRPLYNGPIYYLYGKREEEIVTFWVDEHVRKVTAEKQDELRAKRTILSKAFRVATAQVSDFQEYIEMLRLEAQNPSITEERRQAVPGEIRGLESSLVSAQNALVSAKAELKKVRDQLEITRATNVDDADLKRWFFEGQLRLKQMVEESVPNAKVIATGDCFMNLGGKIIQIVQDNSDLPTDSFLDKQAQKIQRQLKNGGKQPDLILVGGLNLAPTDFSVKYPKAEGLPREITEVAVVQLPTCLDNDFIRRITTRGVKIGSEITRLVKDEDFTSGVVDYCWPCEFPQLRFWSSTDLVNEEIFSKSEEIEKMILSPYQVYGEYESDMQEGAHHQAYYTIPEFPFKVPLYVIHHKFFVDTAAPIHYYANLGDIVQGENHDYHLEVPGDFKITHQLEKEIDKIFRDQTLTWEQKTERIAKLSMTNSILGGTPRVDDQLKNYKERAIIPGAKYFCMVLTNAQKARLEFIEKANIISLLGGNHFENTGGKNPGGVGKHFNEAEIVREYIIKALRVCREFSEEDLERLVVAHKISGVSGALGAFGILPEGMSRDDIPKLSKAELKKLFPYCFSAKHKPSGKGTSTRGLPVKSLRKARSERGPTDPLYEGRFALEVAGHIDRDTSFISRGSLYSVSPAQEFRSPFAEGLDFGLGDIGTKVIGVPKDRKGPIVITRFTYEVFFKYLKNPWPINVKQLFPNAL